MAATGHMPTTNGFYQKRARYNIQLDRDSTIFVWLMANREQASGRQDFYVRMRRNIIKYGDGARTTRLYQKCTRSPRASLLKHATKPYVGDPGSLQKALEMLELARQTLAHRRLTHLHSEEVIANKIHTLNDGFVAIIACKLELTGQISLRDVQLLQSIIGLGDVLRDSNATT